MRLPNLVLAGTPKCGTTSLFGWLNAHPEVCGYQQTFYFMDVDNPLFNPNANYHSHGLTRYYSFFQNCTSETKIIFDSTPDYLYQETALDFFSNCQPQPHIIVVLRQPSSRIFSDFTYRQNNRGLLKNNISFAQFTDLLLEDRGDEIKKYCTADRTFFWLKDQLLYNRYYEWLIQWAKRFPPEYLHILLFEDIIANPSVILKQLSNQLGIESDFYDQFDFAPKNKTLSIRNAWINQNRKMLSSWLPGNRKKIDPALTDHPFTSALKSLYWKVQTVGSSAPQPDSKSLQRLDEYFAPYNQKLATAFNLDLQCWN